MSNFVVRSHEGTLLLVRIGTTLYTEIQKSCTKQKNKQINTGSSEGREINGEA